MNYKIEYYNSDIQSWVNKMPAGIRATYARYTELLMEFGLDLRMPHSKAMGSGLFELRPKGKEGIARIFYCMLVGKKIVMLHGFIKKSQETPSRELKIAKARMREVKNEQKYKAKTEVS
jgi:phage-related protein